MLRCTRAAMVDRAGPARSTAEIRIQLFSLCTGDWHGYLLSHGKFTTLDPPGSISSITTSINNVGEIVGLYLDANEAFHGLLLSRRK